MAWSCTFLVWGSQTSWFPFPFGLPFNQAAKGNTPNAPEDRLKVSRAHALAPAITIHLRVEEQPRLLIWGVPVAVALIGHSR